MAMTVAMDYVLSRFIVPLARLDARVTQVCQSHLHGADKLGGTCTGCASYRLVVIAGKIPHEGRNRSSLRWGLSCKQDRVLNKTREPNRWVLKSL